jgi:two-component system response regulator FixJ
VYESAAELLQRLATEKTRGCIVLDVVMPGISGRTVKDHLQRLGSALPIVFMTGSDEPIQGGPEEVLIKPI